MVKKYVPKAAKEKVAELNLLLDLARGKKTFEQIVSDATDFSYAGDSIENLIDSKASRNVTERLCLPPLVQLCAP